MKLNLFLLFWKGYHNKKIMLLYMKKLWPRNSSMTTWLVAIIIFLLHVYISFQGKVIFPPSGIVGLSSRFCLSRLGFLDTGQILLNYLAFKHCGFTRTWWGKKNVREYRRDNQKWTIQRNWQHRVHTTMKNKTKTQHNMCWTPPYTNKHN